MHTNRIMYTLPQYQKKLRDNYQAFGLILYNKKECKFHCLKPIPATPFLPEGRKRYFTKLYRKTKNINKAKKYTFCTLTYSSKKYTPSEAAMRVKHDLDLFFKRLNYRKSKPEYFYVIELTKDFMVHIHLIFDRYVHKKKIFKSWFKVTGSIATKIKKLKYENAVQYCIKYITKSKNMKHDYWSFIFSHIDRIWTASRTFFEKTEAVEKNWLCLGFGSNLLGHFIRFFDDYDKEEISPPISEFQAGSLLMTLEAHQLLYWRQKQPIILACGIPYDLFVSNDCSWLGWRPEY